MKNISNTLQGIDMFSKSYSLYFDNKSKYSTTLGGLLTIFTLILVIIAFYFFGIDLFNKLNPTVNTSTKFTAISPLINLTMPIAYAVEDYNQVIIEEEDFSKYIQLTLTWYDFRLNPDGSSYEEARKDLPKNKCKPEDFEGVPIDEFEYNGLPKAVCFPKNIPIQGYWNMPILQYIELNLLPCRNETSIIPCAPKEEVDKYISSHQMIVFTQGLYMNFQNYTNLVGKYIKSEYYHFDLGIFKMKEKFMREQLLEIDVGILYESKRTVHFQTVDWEWIDYGSMNPEGFFIQFDVYSSQNKITQTLTYIRLQAVLANVGGFLQIYLNSIGFLLAHFYNQLMLDIVAKSIYKVDSHEKPGSIFEVKDNLKEDKKEEKLFRKIENININEVDGGGLCNNMSVIPFKTINNLSNLAQNMGIQNVNNSDMMNQNINLSFNKQLVQKTPIEKIDIVKKCNSIEREKNQLYKHSCLQVICLAFCSKYMSSKFDRLRILTNFSKEYTDVLTFSSKFTELSKLKFLLMDENQLALFNYASKPKNPLNKEALGPYSMHFKLEHDKDQQRKLVIESYKNLKNTNNEFDRKLIRMFDDI